MALGCMALAHPRQEPVDPDEGVAQPVFRRAVELGITLGDTANVNGTGTALALEHYLSLARRWWGLVLFIGTCWFPALVAYVGVRRLRRLAGESKARRTSQGIVDQTG
jgi:hypothetical protein